jgi:hypothetical protein
MTKLLNILALTALICMATSLSISNTLKTVTQGCPHPFSWYGVEQCEQRTCWPCLCALVDDDSDPNTPDVYMCLDYSELLRMKKKIKELHYGPAP